MARLAVLVVALLVSLFLGMQLVPSRIDNPPVRQGPDWSDARTRELAQRACFDCHSNETRLPWYAHIAPVSWLVRDDVLDGRSRLNFSEMGRPQDDADEAGDQVREGKMPPSYYMTLHPEARMTDSERLTLAEGLDATLGADDHD